MLRKLLKYEFKSTARIFGVCYLALIAAAVLTRLFGFGTGSQFITEQMPQMFSFSATVQGLSATFFAVMILVVAIVTLILIIQRFWKNLLGEEGYLMHTLPVTASQQIASKLIAAVVWVVFSGLVCMAAMLIVASGADMEFLAHLFSSLINPAWMGMAVKTALMSFAGLVSGILQLYVAIMIGQLASRHRILLAVAAYFGIDIILSSIVSTSGALLLGVGNSSLIRLILDTNQPPEWMFNMFFGTATVWYIVLCAVFFCITAYLMKHRLNLE